MKIKKQATSRHESTQSPMIKNFVEATSKIPLYQIPAHLASFPKLWPFPRGDTYHWIPVLNRFDTILELFNKEYGLENGIQTESFGRRILLRGDAEDVNSSPEQATTDSVLDTLHIPTDGDRELIEHILDFTRLLLENCGNRSLYSSSGHLDKLLNTTSASLLKTTLRLSLRLAQRYHAARMRLAPATLHPTLLASHYNLNLDKVQKLAIPFAKGPATSAPLFSTPAGKGKDKLFAERRNEPDKTNPADLVGLFALPDPALEQEFGGVHLSYYEPTSGSDDNLPNQSSTSTINEPPSTPTPARRTPSVRSNQTPRTGQSVLLADSPVTPSLGTESDTTRSNGLKVLELSSDAVGAGDIHDLLKEGLAEIPETAHYEFLCKLRTAHALHRGSSGREDAISIRLLAIANLGYVHGEKDFYTKLGQQDADEPRRLQLAYQLAELVHPPGNGEMKTSKELQTFALHALEALVKHKTKAQDVCTALAVNVNHGVLFYIVRKAVAELGVEEDGESGQQEDDWREALFSLLNTLPQAHGRTAEGMVSAGLLEILVDVLTLRTKKAERFHPRVLQFLDTFVYNLRDAFAALVSAKGLDIIAELTAFEVNTSKQLAESGKGLPDEYKTQLTDYQIPFYHQQTLRWLFKFLNHMMSHTGGNFDRLMRNLIDSPQLLGGLRTVLSNATTFGSTVWSMAVNILTNFIHNEPTSYAVIAEARLSEAFLDTVAETPIHESSKTTAASSQDVTVGTSVSPSHENPYVPREPPQLPGILPHAEAISTLPPAFGAICLTEAGMKVFQTSTALARFFEIFESPAHIKALDGDPEIPGVIGASFDELIRHHPQLKENVLDVLRNMIKRVVVLCSSKAQKQGVGAKLWYEKEGRIYVAGGSDALAGPRGPIHQQITNASVTAGGDVDMQDVKDDYNKEISYEDVVDVEDGNNGPTTAQYIGVVCRFLSGFFGNHAACIAFIEADGVESILDFATLPCLSPRFNEPGATGDEIGRVLQVLVEQKPHLTIPSMLKRAQAALDRLEPLTNHTGPTAFFASFTDLNHIESTNEQALELYHGTEYVKSLVTIQTLVGALTMTFQSQVFTHRSPHNVSSQVNLADMYARLVHSLGKLHRSCVWEEILLHKNLPSEWEKETRIKGIGFGTLEVDNILHLGTNDQSPTDTSRISGGGAGTGNSQSSDDSRRLNQDSARFKNTQILRYLLSKVPTGIAPFFQSLGKLLLFRRNLESYQRQSATVVSDQLAQAAIDQLRLAGPKQSGSVQDRYAYWIVILTSMSQLMIETNVSNASPHTLTLILVSFRNLGGLTVLADVLNAFYETAISIVKTPKDDLSEDTQRLLNLSLGGIKIIMTFYGQTISTKVVNEASQTASMQSRPDRDRERADFFSTAQFLVELRHSVISQVQKIWNSELIDQATTSIVKTSISILKTVLEGDTEHGAHKTAESIPKRNKPVIKPWKPRNEESVKRLKDLGYNEDLVKEALYRCCDTFSTAREYCQNQNTHTRASRNPLPSYETELRSPSTASPHRAEVVVPAHAETDNTSDTASDESDEDDDESDAADATDARSVEMQEADDSHAPPATAPVISAPQAQVIVSDDKNWDFLAYRNRIRDGNVAETVALDDLDRERANLRKNLIDRSLDILNSHDGVTFELADLITAAIAKAPDTSAMRSEIGSTLVQSLISLQTGEDLREQGKKIAASALLLALVLQDKEFYDATIDELKDSFEMLLEFVKISPSSDQSADISSPWIGHILLVVERLLSEDQLPHQIQWSPPSEENPQPISVEQLPEPIISLEHQQQLFDKIMDILPRIGKDEGLALSVTRVLVMITRTRKIAIRLSEKRNIQRLFLMIKQLAGITNDNLRGAFMIVLRHIVEDEAIIRQVMRSEIQAMFETRDRRTTDTTGYTRTLYYLALRDPEIFVQVTNEKVELSRFDINQRPQSLVLKSDKEPDASESDTPDPTVVDKPSASTEPKNVFSLERTKTSDLKPPVNEHPDGVVHYLLCELLAYKEVEDKAESPKAQEMTSDVQPSSSGSTGVSTTHPGHPNEPGKLEKPEFKTDAHPIYIYRCFILKCLAELLQSYNRSKIEFINFSRKADPHVNTPSKPRGGVLNYLLNALVPVGSLNHEGDLAFKKKVATSNCAIDVLVSLCAKTGEYRTGAFPSSPYVETEQDLLFVRKFVLEHSLKAFKDANASDEPLEMKYSRLLNIADIFSRMISQRADGQMLSQNAELTPPLKQMAKIMYEKNFITILTTAIADIDLNFPNAKRAVKYILKPLKWLCAVAVDLSTQYDSSSTLGMVEEYEISSASDDDDLINTTREETPDLFRNSTLGMYEVPHESESEPSEDDDEDPYADDMEYDDEMGYDEDMADEDVVSEDDEDMDIGDMGPIEGLPGDLGDVEIIVEGEDEDMLSDEDDEEEDDDDLDEDEDDEDDEDDDMDAMEELDEITGDGENASLADEESWSGDGEDFAGHIDAGNVPPALGFVFDPRAQMLDPVRSMNDLDDFMEDNMQEDEDDEEEEEFDEEDIVYHPGLEDEEEGMAEMGWGWDDPAPQVRHTHRLSPWMFPGGPGDRILVPAYRSHRPGAGPRVADDGVNPLLQRVGRTSGRGVDSPFAGFRNEGSDWVHLMAERGPRAFPGDSPVSFISNLLNAMTQGTGGLHQHNGAIHLSFNNLPLGLPPPFDPSFRRDMPRTRDNLSRAAREDPHSAVAFHKAFTNARWQEEARILYGTAAVEKSARVVNSILNLLVPPAIQAAQEKAAETDRKRKEDQERKERKEKEDKEAREAKEREEQEQREREAADAELRAAEGIPENDAQSQPTNAADGQTMEGVVTSTDQPSEAGPSEAAQRITTNVRGREIDITNLGIDLEYLEALPEELREEVLMQQIAESRARQTNTEEANPTDINQEFLDALPPEIREELLQQEAQDRRRREREEQRRRQAGAPQPEDMDPASFLASLDPQLRQAVLMEQDEDVLRQLPPEISAEARAYGSDRRLNQLNEYHASAHRRQGLTRTHGDDPSQKKKARPCVQMLDKSGVATLLRLMFIPQQGSAKASLSHILRNVCENRQNRAEVISILLSILQDGSADVNAVERSFAQLSLRAKQPQQGVDKTPKHAKKSAALSINPEVSPLMVVQQCLHTLFQLTEKNPAVWSFFLTEHETMVGFKSRGNRKGKAKETRATKYPLNALLGLLDRKLIIESSSIMEQLTTLLRVITGPLQVLKKDKENTADDSKTSGSVLADPRPSDGSPSTTEPVAAQPEDPLQQPQDDTQMIGAADAPVQPPQPPQPIETAVEGSSAKVDKKPDDEKSKKNRTLAPPDIPDNNLCLVARILAARECNSKVFQETLSVISNLSPILGAKEIFGKELLGIAQDLAQSTLDDLAILTVQVSHAKNPTDVQGMALSKFSPASSDQAKLLRALTALDYLFDPTRDSKDKPKHGAEALEPSQKEDILLTLYENSTFGGLWNKLSECLTVIRQRGNMLNIATILLPLIEALMVVCKNTTLKDAPLSKLLPKEFALSSPPPENRMESLFFTFTEDHRKILNDLVRQNPKLMSGTFSLLVKNSKVLEFDNKRNYFNRKLHARTSERDRHPHAPLQLSVRRDQVFLDSFKSLYFKTADEMKYGKLSVRFHGEEGVDAGGVTREWFQAIARQMFDADYALFLPVASDRTTFHPNRLSAINPEHLMFFKFIGRVIGKALYEGRVLDCHFSRAVYKRMLSRPVNLKDMETLDLEYYKSLQWMLENDITDIITETFSVDVEAFGEPQTVDLIENGRNVPVTEENKQEYVRLVTEHRLTGAVHEQLEHFLKGFHDIVPAELIAIFSEQELELLISGLPDINVDDWKNNTEYHNYTAASPQIQWFWRAVRSFDKEERAKLLQFVTGTSKVPLNGFKELEGMNGFSRFNIHRDYGSKDRLPSSHTCFNQLDLPEYESYEDLRKQLYTAVTAGGEYFGFA